MAIDSAERRKSLVGIITGVMPVGVTPNASQDAEWRQEAGWGYSGIAASGEPAPVDAITARPRLTISRGLRMGL